MGKVRSIGIWIAHGVAIGGVFWIIAITVLIQFLGDRWWIGTFALYSPRWVLALPVLAGVGAWPWLAKYVKWAVAFSALLACWGILGIRIPWASWLAKPQSVYRVMTCNVAGWRGGTDALEKLIHDECVDIVMLQEYNDKEVFDLPDGWSQCRDGHLFIASRYPLHNIHVVKSTGQWPHAIALFCDAKTPGRTIPVVTMHLTSPHYGLSELTDSNTIIAPSRRELLIRQSTQRGIQSARIAKVASEGEEGRVVGGDFNMPVESVFFRQHWHDFQNAFSCAGFGFGNTRFVEKAGIRWGARIDHLLTRGRWHPLRCWVGPDVGSDHRPVLAEVYWE